jgi:hypothetical protein
MTAQATVSHRPQRKAGTLLLPFAAFVALIAAAGSFVTYALWPSWPGTPVSLDAPALPITVAGVLFEVPPAAIRAAVQRHPGPQERIDLAFLWPSLSPPQPDGKIASSAAAGIDDEPSASSSTTSRSQTVGTSGRLFVTIAALGSLLPPAERLRSVYPHYVEAQASAGANGLAILQFRTSTPYEGEDLIYFAGNPERFYSRCTRDSEVMPGTCINERAVDAADVMLRFPRDWLEKDWRGVAAGFDRLLGQLHPQGS